MQALILAGGKGTRLRPLTVYTPKPIVPICNRPFLLYQIDTLRRAGITDITLSLSYQPNKIEQLLGDGSDFGVKLKYTVEPQPMGTAGAYKFAEDLIREPTVVFNGDILTDLDLKAVIREHNDRGFPADFGNPFQPVQPLDRLAGLQQDKVIVQFFAGSVALFRIGFARFKNKFVQFR